MTGDGKDIDAFDPTVYEFEPDPKDLALPSWLDIELNPQTKERVAVIRTTDRMIFKRCRRKWHWSSHLRQNLGMKEGASPLWMGSGFHFALEDFHGLRRFDKASEGFSRYAEATKRKDPKGMPASYLEDWELANAMLDYYQFDWLKHRQPLNTHVVDGRPQVEVNFRVDIPVPQTYLRECGFDRCVYSGTLDRVIMDEWGQLWIVEYKTAKSIQTLHLANDSQVSSYCVPTRSEILTRTGWKRHEDLIIGEEVLGYNIESGKLEWTKLGKVNLPGKQRVSRVSGKSFSFVCTPDHKWVKGVKHLGLSYKNNPKTTMRLVTSEEFKGNSYFLFSAPYEQGTSDVSPTEAAILGWLLTDGSHTRADDVSIVQSKVEHIPNIQRLLDSIPGSYTRISKHPDGHQRWHLSASFIDPLWEKAGLNHIMDGWEQFVLSLSPMALDAFCEAAIDGDGHRGPSGAQFFQNQGTKHELFRLAFFLRGQFPTKATGQKVNAWSDRTDFNTFTISEPRKWSRQTKIEDVGEEEVWCPTTELGTWVMRQDGQVAITGNCWAGPHIYGQPVIGVIYQQHRKDLPKEPKVLASGRLSLAKDQLTTRPLFRKALVNQYGSVEHAPGDMVEYLNELAKKETIEGDKFVDRRKIERNDAQVQAEGEKILMEAMDMINPNLPLYPNPMRDCQFMCSFNGACVSLDDGSDWEYELELLTKPREAVYDSWRKLIEYPDRIAHEHRLQIEHIPGENQTNG